MGRKKTGGRAAKPHEIARAPHSRAQPEASREGLLVAGGDPRPPEVVEAITTQVLALLTECTPRQDIYAALSHLPPRTVDDYIRRARGRMVEAQLGEQKELLADSLARVEWRLKHGGLESRDQIQGERLLAELRGLLGVRGSVVVQQNVNLHGAQGQAAPAGDLSRLSSAAQVVLEWLTAVYEGEVCMAPVDALRQLLGEVGARWGPKGR